jgi:hypothetical protein
MTQHDRTEKNISTEENTIQCDKFKHYTTLALHCTALHYTISSHKTLHCTALYPTTLRPAHLLDVVGPGDVHLLPLVAASAEHDQVVPGQHQRVSAAWAWRQVLVGGLGLGPLLAPQLVGPAREEGVVPVAPGARGGGGGEQQQQQAQAPQGGH